MIIKSLYYYNKNFYINQNGTNVVLKEKNFLIFCIKKNFSFNNFFIYMFLLKKKLNICFLNFYIKNLKNIIYVFFFNILQCYLGLYSYKLLSNFLYKLECFFLSLLMLSNYCYIIIYLNNFLNLNLYLINYKSISEFLIPVFIKNNSQFIFNSNLISSYLNIIHLNLSSRIKLINNFKIIFNNIVLKLLFFIYFILKNKLIKILLFKCLHYNNSAKLLEDLKVV